MQSTQNFVEKYPVSSEKLQFLFARRFVTPCIINNNNTVCIRLFAEVVVVR